MADLRAEIDRYTCATWSPEARQWSLEMLSDACEAPAASRAHPAIARIVRRTRAVLLLAEAAYDGFYAEAGGERLDRAAADALARRWFWRDAQMTRAISLQLAHEQHLGHLRCDDCPAVAPPERVEVAWGEFIPFLLAYVWPVQPAPDAPVELYVCSGLNGAAGLPANEPLKRAGFLVAGALADDPQAAAEIAGLRQRHNRSEAPSADGLARELQAFLRSPVGGSRVCRALDELAWFTGVVVPGCADPAAEP